MLDFRHACVVEFKITNITLLSTGFCVTMWQFWPLTALATLCLSCITNSLCLEAWLLRSYFSAMPVPPFVMGSCKPSLFIIQRWGSQLCTAAAFMIKFFFSVSHFKMILVHMDPQKGPKLYFMYARPVVGDLTTIKAQKEFLVQNV